MKKTKKKKKNKNENKTIVYKNPFVKKNVLISIADDENLFYTGKTVVRL